MRKMSKYFILGLVLTVICVAPLYPQTPGSTPADSKATAANPAPAGQAPDEVMKKLSDLVHAGKYEEAQQLTSGLLVAYPTDQRLIKAKTLVDKLLAPASPANTTPSDNQPTSNGSSVQPGANMNSVQFTGMDRVEYNSLIELARQAQQTTDLEQQTASLKQFMDRSSTFLQKYPDQMLLWQLRAFSALTLNDLMAGYEAGQKLLAAGAADSNDPNLQQLLSRLNLKGWLDKQKMEDEQKKQANTAEAARLKTENDNYTFSVERELFLHNSAGRLTVNENDAVFDGPDGKIRFSKNEIREITVNVPTLRFALKDGGKSFTFAPEKFYDEHDNVLLEKVSLLMNAFVERWRFVLTDGDTPLKLYQKKTLKPSAP
jgi:hypothetical protein